MQLDRLILLIFCLLTGLLSCSKCGENADLQGDALPAPKEQPGTTHSSIGHKETTPPSTPTHPQAQPTHPKGTGVNQRVGEDVGKAAGSGTPQDLLGLEEGNGGHDGVGGIQHGHQQQQNQEKEQKETVSVSDNVDGTRQVPSDTGVNSRQPETILELSRSAGKPQEGKSHQNSESAQVMTENKDGVDASMVGTVQQDSAPTVHIPGVSLQDARHGSQGKAREEHAALSGADNVHMPAVPHFTSTTTVTASTTSSPSTTDSPQSVADQLESPPVHASAPHHEDSVPQESANFKSSDTVSKVEIVKEQLLVEDDGVMLEKTAVKTEETQLEEDIAEGQLKAEDFPSFGEWRQKVLEEQEKEEMENQKVKQMAVGNGEGEAQPSVPLNTQKLRVNYAAKVCGAKVVASNPEMENGNHMLTVNKDEYMINPCSARKWFVVELCEPVMVKMVELASLELFSSHPHSFRVALSDRYPTKEWVLVGTYDMTVDKLPQMFTLKVNSPYVKFVRVEMLDHFGNEHYCPVTHFRVFGVPIEDDDDEEENSHHAEGEDEEQNEGNGESKTLFTRTKETVVNLVKKVLYKGEEQEEAQDERAASAAEKPANISSEGNLPCDPYFDGESIPEKPLERKFIPKKTDDDAEFTVHHPQPTLTTMQGLSTSAAHEEIPMVTKLDDGDQVEIEDTSREGTGRGQSMVRLLQSGNKNVWGSALNYCRPRSYVSPLSCSYKPVCIYVQTMMGEPPPITFQRQDFDVTLSSTIPPVLSSSASSSELEPSLPESVTPVREVESSASVVADYVSESSLEPSSEGEELEGSQTSAAETAPVPTEGFSARSKPGTTTAARIVDKKTSADTGVKHPETTEDDNKVGSMDSTSERADDMLEITADTLASDADPNVATKLKSAKVEKTDSQVIETDADSASPTTAATTEDDVTTTPAATSADGHTSKDAHREEETTEILEPSIHLEVTSVVSPSLTRPTPVLEVERASVESGIAKPEVQETAVPCVSPSPTSVSVDNEAGDMSQPPYPDIVAPTIEPSQKVELQPPSSELASDNGAAAKEPPTVQNVSVPQDKNQTEKKTEDIDLIHLPLSVNAKRETAIMRLTNRIKALELNVSLSSRFLEELSTRFKKQNEELMKILNKTISRINATATASHRQNQEQEVRIERLEMRLDNLTLVVQQLSDRFDSFAEQMTDRQMIATSVNFLLVLIAFMMWCRSCKPAPLHPDLQFLLDTMPRRPPLPSSLPRRNSDVTVSGSHHPNWGPAVTLRKGGSAANLGSVTSKDGTAVSLQDQSLCDEQKELGPKKKKRRKSKAFKGSSGDLSTNASNGNNSHVREVQTTAGVLFGVGSEGRASSGVIADDAWSGSGKQFGHRRCGSASANISPSKPEANVSSKESKSGVQFLLGGRLIPPHHEPPQPVPQPFISTVPDCFERAMLPLVSSCVRDMPSFHLEQSGATVAAKPPLPPGSLPPNHSKISSFSATLFRTKTGAFGSHVATTSRSSVSVTGISTTATACRLARPSRSVELPQPSHPPVTSAVPSHSLTTHQLHSMHDSHLSKAKKLVSESMPILNGDRGAKGGSAERLPTKASRKGSFRSSGGGLESGKGGKAQHEPTKFKIAGGGGGLSPKPWRGQSF